MARVLIVAGEASGDMHAAHLVRRVQARDPSVAFSGIGGPRMREAGVDIRVDAGRLAVVGLVEVLRHWHDIKAALRSMRSALREERPDLLILVDYPEFNLRLARTARELGIPVLYYISPQVWAWRRYRVRRIRRDVDLMAVVFPFEQDFYRRHGVQARFVGHPLLEHAVPRPDRASARRRLDLPADATVIGLFPGSRHSELRRLMPLLLDTARRLHAHRPRLRFLLAVAPTLGRHDIEAYTRQGPPLPLILADGGSSDAIAACDVIATASGTATLEIGLHQVPMVIVYRIAPLSYALLRHLVHLEHIGLCNIVACRRVVPELLQGEATPARLTAELERILGDPAEAQRMRRELGTLEKRLGTPDDADRIENVVLEMLARRAPTPGREGAEIAEDER